MLTGMMRKAKKGTYIGLILSRLRKEKGFDQDALAAASGVPQSTISRIESTPDAEPRLSTLVSLASALGVPLTAFFPELQADAATRESLSYWKSRGPLSKEEEEFLDLLRDPKVGPEFRRLARLFKETKKEGKQKKRGS